LICLLLIAGCGHHQPAPVEEQSASSIMRLLSSDGSYYVRTGDTLYSIAFNFDVDAREVARWNDISSPYVIYPGQKLRLSGPPSSSRDEGDSPGVQISTVKTPGQATTRTQSSPAQTSAQRQSQEPVPVKSSPAPKASSTSKTTVTKQANVSTSTDPKSWKWPADGRVIRGYVAGDPARNGVDIAGKEGQAISASSGGQVVYSGNGLIGYGELIIIKHSERMLSAYAHNKIRLVNEGEQVSSGQKIAEMGRNSAGDQILHFEIRARGKPVNPLNYLPKK
jgi:lipoprotein NlpD